MTVNNVPNSARASASIADPFWSPGGWYQYNPMPQIPYRPGYVPEMPAPIEPAKPNNTGIIVGAVAAVAALTLLK